MTAMPADWRSTSSSRMARASCRAVSDSGWSSRTKDHRSMLTGPVTMLRWSFVRDDQPESETALQLALAIRDELVDLQSAGIEVIQVDEPGLREGLPLRAS